MQLFYTTQILSGYNIPVSMACKEGKIGAVYVRGKILLPKLKLNSASKLYRPSDHRLLAKLAPTFADRGCHAVSVTDPYGRNLDFLSQAIILIWMQVTVCTNHVLRSMMDYLLVSMITS
jgi:hypothetical protein